MVRTLTKNSGGYTVTAARIFGAWGEVRGSSGPSASKGRYVANLGHVQDDESGLLYMRARYYEPGLGRFVSEDPALHGGNWFIYASNRPIDLSDPTGTTPVNDAASFYAWAQQIFANWGIDLPNLPKRAQIVIDTIATVQLFSAIAGALDTAASFSTGSCLATMWMVGTPFAWVPAMLSLAGQGARFVAILCRVIALATFAQCALQLYVAWIDEGAEVGI